MISNTHGNPSHSLVDINITFMDTNNSSVAEVNDTVVPLYQSYNSGIMHLGWSELAGLSCRSAMCGT
jgi:hypothetical protein